MIGFGLITTPVDNNEENPSLFTYESYMNNSIDDMNDIITMTGEEYGVYSDYLKDTKIIKRALSTESVDMSMEGSFSQKTRTFFIKTWTFLVDIFKKFIELIINIITAISMFVRKKMAERNRVIKEDVEKNIIKIAKGMQRSHKQTERKALNEKMDNSWITTIDGSTVDQYIDFLTKNDLLKQFLNESNTVNQDPNSKVGMKNVYQHFVSIMDKFKANPDPTERDSIDDYLKKIATQSEEIRLNYMIMGDRVYKDPNFINSKESKIVKHRIINNVYDHNTDKYNAHLSAKELAHLILIGSKEHKYERISVGNFIACDIIHIDRFISKYKMLNDTVFKYMAILENDIKRCKETFVNDYKLVSAIQQRIVNEINKIDDKNYNKFPRIRTVTDLVLKIKSLKQNYISVRQYIIIDILKMKNQTDSVFKKLEKTIVSFPDIIGTKTTFDKKTIELSNSRVF